MTRRMRSEDNNVMSVDIQGEGHSLHRMSVKSAVDYCLPPLQRVRSVLAFLKMSSGAGQRWENDARTSDGTGER